MVRLKAVWEQEYEEWTRRDLSRKRYGYFWADGLHVNVRIDEEPSCILVITGADEHGNKELVAVSDGYNPLYCVHLSRYPQWLSRVKIRFGG